MTRDAWLLVRNALCLTIIWGATSVVAQDEANYDESRVPGYTLPDPLRFADGEPVKSAEQWWKSRRDEILGLFEEQMYGRAPGRPEELHWDVVEQSDDAIDGLATRRQVTIFFGADEAGPQMELLIYLPKNAPRPVPVFLGLNFGGNHTIVDDPRVRISASWMRPSNDGGVQDHRATEAGRGRSSSRWPVREILQRGYGLAVVYYGDIDPDFDDGFQNGVHALYHGQGKAAPTADQWGSIATWAWGLSRVMDYFAEDTDVDQERVAVVGHSRLGKTALWAGARDQRFALVISNDSGCGGAALSRRCFGETVRRINTSFPHWFCDNFQQYNGREDQLPIDQHELVALVAPRPVLVCSAEDDRWADPKGEFLSARHAAPVYRLLGATGLEDEEMPDPNQLVGDRVGYHLRPGKHDMTLVDWNAYMDFADRFLKRSQ